MNFDPHLLFLFMTAAVALNLTPGPDMLYVAARSTSEGRSAGIVSAFGIATGTLVHIAAVALGLTALLAAVPVAYDILRLTGAAYLVFLGIRAVLRRQARDSLGSLTPASLRTIFCQGLITNVLNPKVALFFLAFFPQFVDAARGPVVGQIVFLGLLFNTSGTLVNVAVAIGASRIAARIQRSNRMIEVARSVTGGIFIVLGLRLALARQR
jgi:threonine/homoserine/homoserine lactone efflux protein